MLNTFINCFFGEDYKIRGTDEELEPLLTREYVDNQFDQTSRNILMVNNHINRLNDEATQLKKTIDFTKLEFNTSEEEIRSSVIDLETRINNANQYIDNLEHRVKELESDDTTKKLRQLFSEPKKIESDSESEIELNDDIIEQTEQDDKNFAY